MNAKPPPNYGSRRDFGPYHRQAVRVLGRALASWGDRLSMWSWGWK